MTLAPIASVRLVDLMTWPVTLSVPVLAVTKPAAALLPSCGVVQPAGTVIESLPLVMPVPGGGEYTN